jgi:hypothetical protein
MYGGHPVDIYHAADIKVFTIFHHSNHIFPHARLPSFSLVPSLSHNATFPENHDIPPKAHPPASPYSIQARLSLQSTSSSNSLHHSNHAFASISRSYHDIPIFHHHLHFTRSSPVHFTIIPEISPSSIHPLSLDHVTM